MAIAKPSHPDRGAKLVREALYSRIAAGGPHRPLMGDARLGAGLPVYRLDKPGGPLGKARMTGWKYLVVGGKAPGLATLHRESGRYVYGGLIEGKLPRRTLEAAVFAEQRLRKSKARYRPRLLEIPALAIYALWLHAPGDNRFVLISRPGRRSGYELEENLERHIKATHSRLPPAKRKR
ncbi:MAG: hypothetical protein ACREHE_13320 [Rhizomicrobium sp.]